MAAVVMLLAIPSGGCLGDLMCSEDCEGMVDCSEYSVAACASQPGCTISGNACTGSQNCRDVADDEDSCKSHEYCHWEVNCC